MAVGVGFALPLKSTSYNCWLILYAQMYAQNSSLGIALCLV